MDVAVRRLLREAGRTYAEEAGITLKDQAAPLFQLLTLASLLSARAEPATAVAAARELFKAGGSTPRGMDRLSWRDRVDALHRAQYDDAAAGRLGDMAEQVLGKYGGDLRRLSCDAGRDLVRGRKMLCELPGIGTTAADSFCREVQAVWLWLRPYFDATVVRGAHRLGLPEEPDKLAALVPDKDVAHLAAALSRVAKDKRFAEALPPAV